MHMRIEREIRISDLAVVFFRVAQLKDFDICVIFGS